MSSEESNREEQEMEAEALAAIFDAAFQVESPLEWKIILKPIDCDDDQEDLEQNHVKISLSVGLPSTYPDASPPDLTISILRGLTDEHRLQLQNMANEEANQNEGMPSVYPICEVLREWLLNHNRPGLDDSSMHAQMLRKKEEEEQNKKKAEMQYEAQKEEIIMSQAEQEELAVRKRRAEGTPCTKENFEQWKATFEAEMQVLKQEVEEQRAKELASNKKLQQQQQDKLNRQTGYDQFSKNAMNLEEMEQRLQQVEQEQGAELDLEELDEDVFDLEDEDDDLDDLDFDDDDDEDVDI